MTTAVRGAIPSPNIWRSPEVYERENHAFGPPGAVEAAMREIRDWAGATVVDIGCGTGFHLPDLARTADRVIGVEPHPGLAALARRRVARRGGGPGARSRPLLSSAREGRVDARTDAPAWARAGSVAGSQLPSRHNSRIDVRVGVAQALPLPDASADVAHARWAYFFGPGCEPGLAELARVIRRGGAAFIVDTDATRSTFGAWFRRGLPSYDPVAVERFWSRHGFERRRLDLRWSFDTRADLEAVLRIEFASDLAAELSAGHSGLDVDYAANLWWRRY